MQKCADFFTAQYYAVISQFSLTDTQSIVTVLLIDASAYRPLSAFKT